MNYSSNYRAFGQSHSSGRLSKQLVQIIVFALLTFVITSGSAKENTINALVVKSSQVEDYNSVILHVNRHLTQKIPIINAMISSAHSDSTKAYNSHHKHLSIILDQPIKRSFLLIKQLLPNARQICLLVSSDNNDLLDSVA